jgi:hypothetical protein
MNFNSKPLILAIILGIGFFLLSKKHNNQNNLNQKQKIEEVRIIDEKKSEITTPKVYISKPTQNGLEIGNNWKSK